MALVTYTTRVAFATTNPFDANPTWTDISAYVQKFDIRRGRQWELNRMESSTAQITLMNLDGRFWPDNSGGAYYPNVLPWKRVNIRATYNATTYDIYTGYAQSWNPYYVLQKGLKAPAMNLNCNCGIKNLSQANINNAGYAQELSGTRVNNCLDTVGWAAGSRSVDAGQSQMQATGANVDLNAMNHLFTVQDTELGIIFVDPAGIMTFQDRHHRFNAPYTVSQATFGDSGTDLRYSDLQLTMEDLRIYNDIRVTRVSGVEQVAQDATSITAYGTRTLPRPSLLMTTDAEALAQAQYLLGRYKNPVTRVKQITLLPNSNPSGLYPCVLGFDLSTRVTIKNTLAGLNRDYHIEGINHKWDILTPETLQTDWMLTDANNQTYWILDSASYSQLDSTTILAM